MWIIWVLAPLAILVYFIAFKYAKAGRASRFLGVITSLIIGGLCIIAGIFLANSFLISPFIAVIGGIVICATGIARSLMGRKDIQYEDFTTEANTWEKIKVRTQEILKSGKIDNREIANYLCSRLLYLKDSGDLEAGNLLKELVDLMNRTLNDHSGG